MIREGILVLGLAATIFAGLWHIGDREVVCVRQYLAGSFAVGDICKVKR